jgi:hydrogenase expression/formation protein HypC
MCLGIPARLVDGDAGHPDLAIVEVGGVPRPINLALLEERPGPGDWVLVHMGFALQTMTEAEAADALAALSAERDAEASSPFPGLLPFGPWGPRGHIGSGLGAHKATTARALGPTGSIEIARGATGPQRGRTDGSPNGFQASCARCTARSPAYGGNEERSSGEGAVG